MDSSAPVPGRRLAYVEPCQFRWWFDPGAEPQPAVRGQNARHDRHGVYDTCPRVFEKSRWKTRNTNIYHYVRKYKD